jgi:NRAMP (natural resistance-associated macrophage protein)-like metal ion transporter
MAEVERRQRPHDPLLKRQPRKDPAPGKKKSSRAVEMQEAQRTGLRGWLKVLGPGLITGASDDDPSGIGTYSQVGSQFGYGMLWTAIFTYPLMAAVQELCARIALQTGVGLGLALRRRFPTWLVGAFIAGLIVANTINIGADLAAVAAGFELLTRGALKEIWLVIPAGLAILAIQVFGSYHLIFKTFKWLTLALFAYVFAAVLAHPNAARTLVATVVPTLQPSAAYATGLVAILGTTISPYLFFWQASSEVEDMRAAGKVTESDRRGVGLLEMRAARLDVLVGMFYSQVVMYCIILTGAAVLNAHGKTDIQTAAQAAATLEPFAGPFASVLFAVGLIGTGALAIPILSGSAAYAVKEFFGLPGNLESKPKQGPSFYLVLTVATLVGMGINFLHIDPIKALFWSAVVNGLVAPPLLILITLLGSDRKTMKDRVSGRLSQVLTWAAAAAMTVAAMVMIAGNWILPRLG